MRDDEKVNRDFLFMGVQPERLDRFRIYDGTEVKRQPCVCAHAPEQHDKDGCGQQSLNGSWCRCFWDGVKP